MRPGTTLKIPVKLGGLNPGEDAKIVVAAVDVGILNLTNYKPPAPDDYYLGQRRLTSEIRDLYGQLIDGMQGTRGQIRSGGDASGGELKGSPPTQKPLALYSGIVTVGADGSAEVSFDIPEFAGTARVMAVAWTSTKLGRATVDVTVRDPVVLTATLPRFLLNGDKGTMSFDLDNVEGAAGDYTVNVKITGPVKVTGNPATTMKLAAKQRTSMQLALEAGGAGTANFDVDIKGPNGLTLARHYALDVKAATQVLARRSIRTLAKGESLTLTSDMFSDLVSGTGSVSLSASLSTALDAATILKALDRYPHGCSEQITSRAMPLLYVNDLAAGAHLAMDTAVDQRIKDAIERLLARQGSNGSFGLWSAGGDDAWLDAYVTDFLTRAREKGFAVPDVLFKSALDRIRNSVVNANEPEKDGGRDLAYGLYVLARNGAAPIGDLRYLADTKLSNLATPIAKSQLAAALALVGDKARAERVYSRRAGSAQSEAGDRVRPHRLRQRAARCRSSGVACQRRQRAAGDADPGCRTGRGGARAHALHLHAGKCLDGAGGTRARQGNAEPRDRRPAGEDRRCSAATRRTRWPASRSGSPTPAKRRCRRWSRCRVRRSRRSRRPPTASRSSAIISRSTASRPTSPRPSRTTALPWC